MELNEKIESIKKILVKCPILPEEAYTTFPFLIALSEEFPKAEISLICEENCSFAYSFLPFKIFSYERPKEKLSLAKTHQFCVNLNDVFNIDLFFDLENTLNSSFMGFNFRAKERVGYVVGWNKYFLTKKFINPGNVSIEKKCMKLLELYTEKTFAEIKISRFRGEGHKVEKIEKLFEEPEPPSFILVMLDNFKNVSIQIRMWTRFFDSFQNQKFIIWAQTDEDLISELFRSIDLGENNLYMHKGSISKELVYLFNKVKGVVTNNVWSEGLCNYFGINAVTLLNNQNNILPEYYYFKFKPQRFIIPEEGPIKFYHLEESRELNEMNQVVDHIYLSFKL
jgi:ADP-heptose:LPS heptosyltransferase